MCEKITSLVFLFSPPLPGLGGTRGEGNVGPHGCSWGQRGNSGWRNLHREIHAGSSGGGEHPQSGEATTGMLYILYIFVHVLLCKSFIQWGHVKAHLFCFFSMKAVTVKEALTAKGRHLRRSISTPNVQHVMNSSLTALTNEQHGNNGY